MSDVTIEQITAKQAEVAALIARFQQQAAAPTQRVSYPAVDIDLRSGESYAGAVLDEDGKVKHHLILMAPRPAGRLDWEAAKAWAADVGGELPSRQEQALLYANCKHRFEADWYWSNEANGSSYAWGCYFHLGNQYYNGQSYGGCAAAVRRLIP